MRGTRGLRCLAVRDDRQDTYQYKRAHFVQLEGTGLLESQKRPIGSKRAMPAVSMDQNQSLHNIPLLSS
jgi:hypothetical protein